MSGGGGEGLKWMNGCTSDNPNFSRSTAMRLARYGHGSKSNNSTSSSVGTDEPQRFGHLVQVSPMLPVDAGQNVRQLAQGRIVRND